MVDIKKKNRKKDKLIFAVAMPQKFDKVLHSAVLFLILFGTVMIISTNVSQSVSTLGKVFAKQLVFFMVSYILLTFFANNFTMYRATRYSKLVGMGLIGMLILTLFSASTLGSRAWIQIPIPGFEVTIQPSEFAKVFMIVLVAVYVEFAKSKSLKFWTIIKVPFIFFIIILFIVFLQNDTGSAIVLSLMVAICTLIPSHKNLHVYQKTLRICIATGFAFAMFLITPAGLTLLDKFPPHFSVRFQNAIDPFSEPYGEGYQLINGLYGLARGGVTGVGVGESIQKYGYLTQSDNDFILSIVVEETGIFGLSAILFGYGIIIQRLIYYALKSKSEGYKIILTGTALYIFIHFALNVGGVGGLIPLTGVPLLFISSGGSSLMSIAIAIGISQSIISRIRIQGVNNKRRVTLLQQQKKEPRGDGAL